jgi:hypothetical protein
LFFLLDGIIEMDETYVGGKSRKRSKKVKDDDDKTPPLPSSSINKRGRGTDKQPVVGMIERGGSVKAEMVNKGDLKSKYLNELIRKNIDKDGSVLVTDEYTGYNNVHKILKMMT